NRYRMDDTTRRVSILEGEQDAMDDMAFAYEMMNNQERGVFSSNYGAWSGTIHTAIYHPKKLEVGIALGGNRPPIMLKLAPWLQGEKWNIKQIKGFLDTDDPFVNMIKL